MLYSQLGTTKPARGLSCRCPRQETTALPVKENDGGRNRHARDCASTPHRTRRRIADHADPLVLPEFMNLPDQGRFPRFPCSSPLGHTWQASELRVSHSLVLPATNLCRSGPWAFKPGPDRGTVTAIVNQSHGSQMQGAGQLLSPRRPPQAGHSDTTLTTASSPR